jgi:hypothetical protein
MRRERADGGGERKTSSTHLPFTLSDLLATGDTCHST